VSKNIILFFVFITTFYSCGTVYDNARDPANICGGVTLDDPLNMKSNGIDVVSAVTKVDGIDATVSLKFKNCTGFDFSGSEFEVKADENSYFYAVDQKIKIDSLKPNDPFSTQINITQKSSSSTGDKNLSCLMNFGTGASDQAQSQNEIITIPDLRANIVADSASCNVNTINMNGLNVTCNMTLKNTGYASTDNLNVVLNSVSGGATITSSAIFTFASIGGKDATISLSFDATIPALNTDYTVNVGITDAYSNAWSTTGTFSATGEAAGISIVSAEIFGDQNGDGILSAGEYAYIKIKIKNDSSSKITNLTGTVSTGPGITLTYPYYGSKLYFGPSIDGGATACGTDNPSYGYCNSSYYGDYLKIKLSSVFTEGTPVPLILNLSDDAGNTWQIVTNVATGSPNINVAFDSVTLLGDINEDGVLSAGETVYLQIKVKNTGQVILSGLIGTVSSNNSNVQISYYNSNVMYFGDIQVGNSSCGDVDYTWPGHCDDSNNFYLKVVLSPIFVNGNQVPFTLNLIDSANRTWAIPFTVNTASPDVNFNISDVMLVSEQTANGKLTPGEYGYLQIKVKNTGTSDAKQTTALLTVNNPNVSVTYYPSNTMLYFGDLDKNIEKCGYANGYNGQCYTDNWNPKILVGASVPNGTSLLFTLTISDALGDTQTRQFNMVVGSTNLSFTSTYSCISDTNGNGVVNSGENFYLKFSLNNASLYYGSGLWMSFVEQGSNYLTIINSSTYFGNINGSNSACGTNANGSAGNCTLSYSSYNRFIVSASAPVGTNIHLVGTLKDSFGNTIGNYSYYIPVQ